MALAANRNVAGETAQDGMTHLCNSLPNGRCKMTRRTRSRWAVMSLICFIGAALLVPPSSFADDKHGYGHKKTPHGGMMGHAPKGHGMHHHMPFSPLAMKEELGLSDEQVNALEALEAEYRKAMIKTHADIRIAEIDVAELLAQKSIDRNAIVAKIDEISKLKKQLMLFRVDTLLKLKEILTPAQYEQFRERLRHFLEHGMGGHMHGETMGHGMMGAPGMGGYGYGKEKMGGYGHRHHDED